MIYKINKDKCIGCGGCVAISNGAIEIGEDGKATIIDQEALKDQDELIDICPVQAVEKYKDKR
ncbi:MAG: ferredoxin [Methanosarcinales archaeon]|nr:ferredoxin [Methanosarcinales archaeon]